MGPRDVRRCVCVRACVRACVCVIDVKSRPDRLDGLDRLDGIWDRSVCVVDHLTEFHLLCQILCCLVIRFTSPSPLSVVLPGYVHRAASWSADDDDDDDDGGDDQGQKSKQHLSSIQAASKQHRCDDEIFLEDRR